ncbi:MAG: helix-turn-helix transcriptional regulator [Gemmatimonadaceae bacterium]
MTDVRDDSELPLELPRALPLESPLVGRARLLHTLDAALSAAQASRGRTVLLTGDSGVGKTRVAQELRDRATARGFRVVAGSANAVEHGIPYSLMSDAMSPMLRSLDAASLMALTRGHAAVLAGIFPTVETLSSAAHAGERPEPEEAKARMFWAFTQLLARLAARQPLLLIIDNLQWADASSLELIHFVARNIGNEHIVMLGTYTTDEQDTLSEPSVLQRSLTSLALADVHRLEPLSLDSTTELVTTIFGDVAISSRAEFIAVLYGWTRGNPLFIREVLRSLVYTGALYQRNGTWHGWDVHAIALPATLHELLRSRIGAVSDVGLRVMITAAVAGARVTHDLLQAVAECDDATLLNAVDELRSRAILAETDDRGGASYEFTHPALRDVALAEAGLVRRKRVHGVIARWLTHLSSSGAADRIEEIAFHLIAADDPAARSQAAPYLLAAGERALARYANVEARNYLATALESRQDLDDAAVWRAMALLARAEQRMGNYEAAGSLWASVRERERTLGNPDASAAASMHLGLVQFWSGNHAAALAAYDDALNEAASSALRVRLRIARGACLQEMGCHDDACRELVQASAQADELDDVALRARAERGLLLLFAWTGPAARARAHGERAIELASRACDTTLLWSAHWAMALLAGLTGDSAGVAQHVTACDAIARELGSPVLSVWTAEVSIEHASGIGDWDAGLAIAERAIPLARSLGQRTLLPRLLVWSALMRLGRGDDETAQREISEAWDVSGAANAVDALRNPHASIPAHTARAAWHLAHREYAEAIRVGEAGLAIAERTGYVVWAIHRLLPIVGEAALWMGDFDRAQELSVRMRHDAQRVEHQLGLAWADACDALLVLFRDGDASRAVPLLRAAAERLEAIPFVENAARVRRQIGSALADLGDMEGASRELKRAHDMFVKLRADGELGAVRGQLRDYGVRPPARLLPPEQKLTGREIQIARLVSTHKSNGEIGALLDISARTVSTHLSNIFAKLGVTSRGELADVVRGISMERG